MVGRGPKKPPEKLSGGTKKAGAHEYIKPVNREQQNGHYFIKYVW